MNRSNQEPIRGYVRLRKSLRKITAAVLFLAGLATSGRAATTTLQDLNSTVNIDPSSQSGMSDWIVNGTDQLAQQWFWYRTGSTGPESSIDTLPLVSSIASDTNFNPGFDNLALRYGTASTFFIDVNYSLQGGSVGSGSSIAETIKITNNSGSPLDFHFFQYSNYDLGGTSGSDAETRLNPNTVRVVGDGMLFSETVASPAASHYELALTPTTINKLNDGNPTTLPDGATTAGPGDVAFAFEWDKVLAAGETLTISKGKSLQLVPEPGTLTLISIGLVGGLVFLRRRR